MDEFSQPTLGLVRQSIERLLPDSALTPYEARQFWKGKLFDAGFPPTFIELASSAYSFNWTEIISDLFVGKFGDKNSHFGRTVPVYFTENVVKKLVVFALTEGKDSALLKKLRESLAVDGFDISANSSNPDGPQNITSEPTPPNRKHAAEAAHEPARQASNEVSIFISHSSLDTAIAAALTELLKNALPVSPEAIRCTSVDGHRLSVGAKTDEQLKRVLLNAKSFIALLTQHSLNSTWVLFELGARWGAERHLAPVFAAGLTAEQLRGPLPGISGLSCDSDNQIHQLVHDIARVLEVETRKTHLYSPYVAALINASSDAKKRRLLDQAKSGTPIKEQLRNTETSFDRKIDIHHIVLETLKRDGTRNFWDSIKRDQRILWLHNYGSESVRKVKVHDVMSASGRYTLVFDEIPVIAAGKDAALSYEILENGTPVYFNSGKDALFAFFSDTNGPEDLVHKYWFGIFSVSMNSLNSFGGGNTLVRELPEMKLKVV